MPDAVSGIDDFYQTPFVILPLNEFQRLNQGERIQLPATDLHHIRKSLRLRGEVLIHVTDGVGNVLPCKIADDDVTASCGVLKPEKRPMQTLLIMAPVKKKHLEIMVQKITELGVDEIHFINSDYSNAGLDKLERLEKIAYEACKQSKNPFLPLIKQFNANLMEYPYEEESTYFWGDWHTGETLDLKEGTGNMSNSGFGFMNGPEGGWSEKERNFLKNRFPCINLSRNVLRSETAAVVGIYQLKQYIYYRSDH
ncbi:MAG: RsmE family RNA methyltransferase [Leptospirales bacterium]